MTIPEQAVEAAAKAFAVEQEKYLIDVPMGNRPCTVWKFYGTDAEHKVFGPASLSECEDWVRQTSMFAALETALPPVGQRREEVALCEFISRQRAKLSTVPANAAWKTGYREALNSVERVVLALPHTGQQEEHEARTAALRKLAIVLHVRLTEGDGEVPNGWSCKLCKSEWDYHGEEKHAPACALSPSLASPRAEGEWRPIETAPKDGRLALVYRPLAQTSGDSPVDVKRLIGGNHHCWLSTVPEGQKPTNPTDGACHVTHWMPIPEPPTIIAEKQTGEK